MYTQYFILVLCLLLLGGSNSAKSRDRDNGWEKSNTMSREEGEHHKEVKKQEIWIDDEDEGSGPDRDDPTTDDEDMWGEEGGSGHGMSDDEEGGSGKDMTSEPTDDEDMMEGSSGISDDEDSTEGSTPDAEDQLSDCLQLQRDVEQRRLLGAYKPDCTENGEFEKVQCHGSVCWCVDKQGRDITGTRGQIGKIQCEEGVIPPGTGEGRIKPIINPGDTMEGKGFKDDEGDEENRDDNDIGYPIDTPTGETNTDINNPPPITPEVKTANPEDNPGYEETKGEGEDVGAGAAAVFMGSPGILAGIIGGAVVGLLCAVLLVMFIVYRMRKKDEGSYPLDEPKKTTPSHSYQKAPTREFYA